MIYWLIFLFGEQSDLLHEVDEIRSTEPPFLISY
jgi:hypothetical protein